MACKKSNASKHQNDISAEDMREKIEQERQFCEKHGWCGLLSGKAPLNFRLSSAPVLSKSSESYKWQSCMVSGEDSSPYSLKAAVPLEAWN
ncbi:MAG: hypothetical protein K6G50_10815 [bacterium]|nr:hypothetical protein [bacterium]